MKDSIGLELDEFVGLGIEGLQLVAPEIGLDPGATSGEPR